MTYIKKNLLTSQQISKSNYKTVSTLESEILPLIKKFDIKHQHTIQIWKSWIGLLTVKETTLINMFPLIFEILLKEWGNQNYFTRNNVAYWNIKVSTRTKQRLESDY